jgi:Zn-dependent alcohol dehydrogenase
MKHCGTIIGVDRFEGRLIMAGALGAAHNINTSSLGESLAAIVMQIKRLTEGAGSSVTIDTTGDADLIRYGMDFTANRGQMILLGAPRSGASLSVHLSSFMQVRVTSQCR